MKLLLLITLITSQYLLALVSIAPVEIGEQDGLSGKIEMGLETKRGNTDKDNYKGSLKATYDNNTSYVLWAELSGEYGKSNSVEDTNKAFTHLRYIHSLTNNEDLRYEVFGQLQSDEFRQINSRILSGMGIRYRVFNSIKRGKGFVGIGGFYERIRYTNPQVDFPEDNTRLNSYLAYTVDFSQKSAFSASIYYQPKLDDFEDFVKSTQLELSINIYQELYLKLNLSWNLDSMPPVGVEESDFTQTTTFVFNF
jgi:hypothetical protein